MLRTKQTVESPRDRVALAHDAGMGKISGVSVLSGTLVAYGAFLVVLAIAGGIAAALGVDTDLGSRDFHTLGVGGGIAVAVVLLISYLFGGYVAGRMARRAGAVNGLLVFVLGLVIAGAVGGAVAGLGGTDNVVRGIRNVGLPTTWAQWRDIGTVAGIASLAAMILGSILGGISGERWHSKLLVRALDPAIGPEGRTRRDAETSIEQAESRHADAESRVRMARADRDVDIRDRDDERLAEAQRDEADAVAADTSDTEVRSDGSHTRGRHFLRR
jgi:hypothetical protein